MKEDLKRKDFEKFAERQIYNRDQPNKALIALKELHKSLEAFKNRKTFDRGVLKNLDLSESDIIFIKEGGLPFCGSNKEIIINYFYNYWDEWSDEPSKILGQDKIYFLSGESVAEVMNRIEEKISNYEKHEEERDTATVEDYLKFYDDFKALKDNQTFRISSTILDELRYC